VPPWPRLASNVAEPLRGVDDLAAHGADDGQLPHCLPEQRFRIDLMVTGRRACPNRGLRSDSGVVKLCCFTMFPQFFGLAGSQTPLLLVLFDVSCALFTGGSVSRILSRERRRRQRREAASHHYARCMEDFPELAQ